MITLKHGDCREVLATLPAASVEACVTDPPYHLTREVPHLRAGRYAGPRSDAEKAARASRGFMGKSWDGGDIAQDSAMWAEVYRVLKPGAHLAAFGGTRTFHRMMCAIEDAGFEIRDTVMWVHSQGFPKSHNLDGEWQGWGSALKPSYEPIVLARKPLIGTIAANAARYGTGAINVDACRIPVTIGQLPGVNKWESDESLCFLCAEAAESQMRLAARATRASIATRRAAPIMNGKAQISLLDTDRPDTGCSDGTMAGVTATSSSIGGSGSWPTGPSQPALKFTTSTATRATIGSPICSSCGRAITDDSTAGSSTSRGRMNSLRGLRRNESAEPASARWPANLAHDGSPEVLAAFAAFEGGRRTSGNVNPTSQPVGYGSTAKRDALPINHADTGTAARFFYSSKSGSEERSAGLDGIALVSIMDECGEVQLAQLLVDTGESPLKVTVVSGIGQSAVSEWSMSWFGSELTALFQQDCTSTTSMVTRSTIGLKILNSLTRYLTNDCTAVVSCEMVNGGNRAANVANGTSLLVTISEAAASRLGVGRAVSPTRLRISASAGRNTHSTVKPLALMQWLCRLVTPPGGTVLDMFCGSGSTLVAADREGFHGIGIEMDAEYIEIARRRFTGDCPLFTEVA